jgi:nucleotide-binding universal stress UspA family protein
MLPKTILVPTDLSVCAEHALDYACQLAGKLDAKVHLLNVLGVMSLGIPELGVALTSTMIETMVQNSQQSLDKLVAARKATTSFGEVLIKTGDPRDLILQTAEALAADLIVMGTHGRRGVSRLLLGSVTEAIVRRAPCPVLTIREITDRVS